MATKSREALLKDLRTLGTGVRKYVTKQPIVIGQRKYSGAQIAKRIEAIVAAETKVILLAAELAAAHAKCRALKKAEASFLDGVRLQLLSRHSHSHATLAELGLSPRRPNPRRSAEERTLMTARNRATRAKRGTLGPKRKKGIRGDVSGVIITPILTREPGDADP